MYGILNIFTILITHHAAKYTSHVDLDPMGKDKPKPFTFGFEGQTLRLDDAKSRWTSCLRVSSRLLSWEITWGFIQCDNLNASWRMVVLYIHLNPLKDSPMKCICCSPYEMTALYHFIGTTAVICTHHIHDMDGFHFIIFRLGCPKTFYRLPPFWRNVGIQRRTFIL